jgi:hypothetical protein
MPPVEHLIPPLFWFHRGNRCRQSNRENSMRIKMDTTSVRFMVTRPGEAKIDHETKTQKIDRGTGALLWQLQLMALDESGAEVLTVTVDSEPVARVGDFVQVDGLVAIPWSQGDRSGVAFRAVAISALRGDSTKAA